MRPSRGALQALCLVSKFPRFRYGQQPKLREIGLVKWFSGRFDFSNAVSVRERMKVAKREFEFLDLAAGIWGIGIQHRHLSWFRCSRAAIRFVCLVCFVVKENPTPHRKPSPPAPLPSDVEKGNLLRSLCSSLCFFVAGKSVSIGVHPWLKLLAALQLSPV